MKEFDSLDKVIELFNRVGQNGINNIYIYSISNMQSAQGGFVAGMERGMQEASENRAWEGYLICLDEKGLGLIPLKNTKPLFVIKPENMLVNLESYSFFNYDEIDNIKIKRLNLISPVAKDVTIKLKNGIEYKLIVRNKEKKIPYHADNFSKFIKLINNLYKEE